MDRTYRIRAASAHDLVAVLALDREIANVPHWRAADYCDALPEANRRAVTGGTSRCLFVAEEGSIVAGFAVGKVAYVGKDVTAELESVGVAEPARRSGIGMALCVAVIEWARKMCATEIELEVRSRSAGPMALYEGLGFAAMGRRPNYYREPVDDAILMRLHLAASPAQVAAAKRDL